MMAHAHAVCTRPSFPLHLEGLGTRLINVMPHYPLYRHGRRFWGSEKKILLWQSTWPMTGIIKPIMVIILVQLYISLYNCNLREFDF